jgi:hypothetical protein
MPEMALVTDIKGECSAAVIKHDVNLIIAH